MWTYSNDVIDMSKYPHLSNVLNREFDDVSKNTEQVGIKEIIQQLQRLVDIQSAEAERLKNERKTAEVEAEKKKKEKEAAEDKTGTGLTPEKLKEARKKSADRIAEHRAKMEDLRTRRDERKNKGKLSQEDKKNLQQRDKIFGKKPEKNIAEEKRKIKEERQKLVERINRNKKNQMKNDKEVSNLIDRMTQNENDPTVNNNAGKNLTNLMNSKRKFNKRFGSKKTNKSKDDESNWFSAVRV